MWLFPGVEEKAMLYMDSPRLTHPEQVADFEKEVTQDS
jgi:hypothetical protein